MESPQRPARVVLLVAPPKVSGVRNSHSGNSKAQAFVAGLPVTTHFHHPLWLLLTPHSVLQVFALRKALP